MAGEGGNAPNMDTILGITYHERKLINDCWAVVKDDLGGNGLLMFTIFFEDYPQHMSYFPFKNTLTKETISKDPMVKLHGLRVMREITRFLDMLEEPDTLLEALKQNAKNHHERHIARSTYDDLRLTILKLLGQQLEQQFTSEKKEVWDKLLKLVFKTITDHNS